MVVLSFFISDIFGEEDIPGESQEIDLKSLTAVFLFLNILCSTMDVATDGWCISILKPGNVGYASTCQSVGLTTGFCVGYIIFTALESKGIITITQFLIFWGVVFLIATIVIAVFKKEGDDKDQTETLGLFDNYKALWQMLRHPTLFKFLLFLITYGVGFSAAESMSNLKLIEKGVPREEIALMEIPMIFVKIFVTLFVSKFTVGPCPMNVWIVTYPLRLLFCLAMTAMVFIAPLVKTEDGGFPSEYYGAIITVFALNKVMSLAMWVAVIAFFARISDPIMGATYMSFFTTLNMLGTMWPKSLSLWLVDKITYKYCVASFVQNNITSTAVQGEDSEWGTCNGKEEAEACEAEGHDCQTSIDGFYILSIVCVCLGYCWFCWAGPALRRWQQQEPRSWRVKIQGSNDDQNLEIEDIK